MKHVHKIYYVANARMPNDKAHGIQIAKMCEAFIEERVNLVLVVPRRGMSQPLRKFYDLRVDVSIVRLPAINLYNYGRMGYFISSVSFMITSLIFLWWKRFLGEHFIIYTIDLDNYSSSALPLAHRPLFTEMHGGKPYSLAQQFLFRHLLGVFAINGLIVDEFKQRFSHSNTNYLVEPNGVDLALFTSHDKMEARRKLNIPQDIKMVLYTGRFFEWKGLEILLKAAEITQGIEWYIVGGTKEEFYKIVQTSPPSSMHFMGNQEQVMIPWWLAAADALIVLGTKRDQQSYLYTSPMKLFEYLLSERCIVASNTPAIGQIVSNEEALLYEPDNAEDFAAKINDAVLLTTAMREKISKAHKIGETHSWNGRARRILTSIQNTLEHDKKTNMAS